MSEENVLNNEEAGTTGEHEAQPAVEEPAAGHQENEPMDENMKKITALQETIKALEAERNDLKDKYLRKIAEFDNYKRRSDQEAQNAYKYAGEQLAIKILPIIDDLERSLQHSKDTNDAQKVVQGIQMIYDKFIKILTDQGIKKMEVVGQPFDVHFHDALMQQPSAQYPANTVLQDILSGYIYKEKVIRHAQVIVSIESDEPKPAHAQKEQE